MNRTSQIIKPRQRGFTLLEILVTLVITALALLGIAGMQTFSLKMNKSGESRTYALMLANEIAERIEANNIAATEPASVGGSAYESAASNTAPACTTVPCDPSDLAAYDVNKWFNQISNNALLPGGSAAITRAFTTATVPLYTYTIRVCWIERKEKLDTRTTTGDCSQTNPSLQTPGMMSVVATRTVYSATVVGQ